MNSCTSRWPAKTIYAVVLALLVSHCSTKGVDGSTHFVGCKSAEECASDEICGRDGRCVAVGRADAGGTGATSAVSCGDGARCVDGGDSSVTGGDSSVTGGDSSATGGTSTATWVTDLTAAYCTRAVRCHEFPDAAVCESFIGPELAVDNFNTAKAALTAVSKGTAHFDPAQAASCLTALSNEECSGNDSSARSIPAPCATVFSGTVPDGGPCIDDVECGSSSMCVIASTTTCEGTCTRASGGPCRTNADCAPEEYCAAADFQGPGFWGSGGCEAVVPPGAAAGDLCGSPTACAAGLQCGGGPAPARCAVGLEAFASCSPRAFGCGPGLACVHSDDGTGGNCISVADLGDACTSRFQCGAEYPVSDTICDETGTHTCVHKPSKGSCAVVKGFNTCDPVTSYCDGSAAGGTCKPWLALGAACDPIPASGIDACGPWAACQGSGNDGVCTSWPPPACTPK